MRNTNKATLSFAGIAGILVAVMGAIAFLVELGQAVINGISSSWTTTHTTLVLVFFFTAILLIVANILGMAGSRSSMGNGNQYDIAPTSNQLPIIDSYATPVHNAPQLPDSRNGRSEAYWNDAE